MSVFFEQEDMFGAQGKKTACVNTITISKEITYFATQGTEEAIDPASSIKTSPDTSV